MKKHLLKNLFLALILFPASYLTASQEGYEAGALAVVAAAIAYKCDQCEKSFSKESKLERHLVSHATERNFECSQCGNHFKSSYDLERHIRRHDDVNRTNVCTICSKAFFKPSELEDHRRVHDGKKLFSCKNCGFEFARKSALCKHTRKKRDNGGICPRKGQHLS